ncbi:coenzyme dependent N5,N10-methylene tetrahydromethanopterin reductase [Saccharata proteae CBS 121410]|uniref:Coenzyme dependent N5,N10-methylene tetrahydromethanopterin reductase n=1 Tax=Saccharata proteae CBS 121410 TaxID=1314787 RepID=A0A9P4I160_9PEZI|nr:coenzyme dependent N5,N10-methylene tetrahydromethanopterin reductase [Saccharata proteae CBS 121410]
MASGQWKTPEDTSRSKDTLQYYINLARIAERGKISAIFFADWYAGFEVYGGSMDAMLSAGHQVAHLDPLPIISAMAAVTESLSFAVTMSTSYANPYVLARQFSTLDHLTGGRCAWNIVTSWSKSAALALGKDDVVEHDERYAIADEYMDVVYKLWESSWAPESVLWDHEKGIAFDATKIKNVEHKGKYFEMTGRSQVHPSPQRTPVLFQAGTSKSGTAFAVKHAEAIFLNTSTVAQAAKTIKAAREAAAAGGRDPQSLKFFPCIVPFVGRSEEEAKAKYEYAKKHADPIAGLGQFSGYTGIDMARYPLDEPFDLTNDSQAMAIQSVFKALEASLDDSGPWTPRKLGMKMALGGLHPSPIGSAELVADVFEQWVNEADCDGFNIASVTNPGSWEDVVHLLRPELVKRGLVGEDYDYPAGTFRENLLGRRSLRDDHYGSRFKWRTEQASA